MQIEYNKHLERTLIKIKENNSQNWMHFQKF